MQAARRLTPLLALLTTAGCALDVPETTAPLDRVDAPDGSSPATTNDARSWPTEARFAETAAALPRPFVLVSAAVADGPPMLALAHREGGAWTLGTLFRPDGDGTLPEGCEALPCPWPASLVPERPLTEAAPLPEPLRDAVVYAQTLVDFEGPLDLQDSQDTEWLGELPESAWSDPGGAQLAPYLERLRRYHPVGQCSMDNAPQIAAQMRAHAAAQAGHTGWAVQGWIGTVGYWSSSRMAASSYGQGHPDGHAELLERVDVDPRRLLLGLLLALPDRPARLALADVRRVAQDFGPAYATDLRALAADARVDSLNRALLFAVVADLPFTDDAQYADLPAESRALLDRWSR